MNISGLFRTLTVCRNEFVRSYAFKSDLKIKWVRPEKIPCYKPEKSGDLSPMPQLEKSRYPVEFQGCKELETADENVKRIFSLEFAPTWKRRQVFINDMYSIVQRHPLDKGSIEARIARWTGCVRALQDIMEAHPRNKRVKVKLKELIDKRKKHLKYLRRWDYKRFEWLLENLNIVFKPPPNEFHWITRKDSLRKLTNKYEDELRTGKLTAYRLQLEEEQPSFLKEKIATLEFIRDEQKDCGVDVTVTDEEIENVRKQLDELLKRRESNDV